MSSRHITHSHFLPFHRKPQMLARATSLSTSYELAPQTLTRRGHTTLWTPTQSLSPICTDVERRTCPAFVRVHRSSSKKKKMMVVVVYIWFPISPCAYPSPFANVVSCSSPNVISWQNPGFDVERRTDKKMDRFEHADATLHGGAVDTSRAMAVALPPILIALAPNLKAALHPFPLVMGVWFILFPSFSSS